MGEGWLRLILDQDSRFAGKKIMIFAFIKPNITQVLTFDHNQMGVAQNNYIVKKRNITFRKLLFIKSKNYENRDSCHTFSGRRSTELTV